MQSVAKPAGKAVTQSVTGKKVTAPSAAQVVKKVLTHLKESPKTRPKKRTGLRNLVKTMAGTAKTDEQKVEAMWQQLIKRPEIVLNVDTQAVTYKF